MNKRGHVSNAILLSIGLGVVLTVSPTTPLTPATAEAAGLKVAELFVPVVLGALFPDVDTAFGKHRKLLHNVFVVGILFGYILAFDNLHYVWIGVLTHYVLDIAGSKRGLALLYPLTSKEYNLPTGVATSSGYAGVVTVVITIAELAILAGVHYYVVSLNVTASQATQALATIGF
ncbi:MAG: metal-dependent hydrolase [Haloferacaceae archaeon]